MTRLVAALVLGLGLQATTHLAGSALDGVAGTQLSSAHAQVKFTGKIKRIKIKKRRTGGYKIVSRSASPSTNTIAAAQVKIAAGDGSEVGVFSTTVDDVQVFATTLATFDPEVDVMVVSLAIVDGFADDAARHEVDVELFRDAEGAFHGAADLPDGSLTARVVDGTLTLKIGSIAPGPVQVAYQSPDGDVFLDAVEVRQVARMTTDLPLDTYGQLTVQTTLFGKDGAVIDTRSETLDPTETYSAGLDKVSVRSTRNGGSKVVAWTTSRGGDSALTVVMADADTGEAVLDASSLQPVDTERGFLSDTIAFEDVVDEGTAYLVLIDALDDEGNPTGAQHEAEILAPALVEGQTTSSFASFADGAGQLALHADANGYYLAASLHGRDTRGVNLIFEEPFEGPAPLETEVDCALAVQLDKWVVKSTTALPATVRLRAEVTGGGNVLGAIDGVRWEGTGAVYTNPRANETTVADDRVGTVRSGMRRN